MPRVIADLGPLAQFGTAPRANFVQACLGADLCRYGKQDSIGLARALDESLRDMAVPAKIKIGVSGCPRCCSESHTRDIGLIASPGGVDGLLRRKHRRSPAARRSHRADLAADEAVDCARRLAEYYREHAQPRERTAPFMERIGIVLLRSEVLALLPYIPLETVKGS